MVSDSIWQEGEFHLLSDEQITQLKEQHCTCEDWSKVKVSPDFNTEKIHSTHFSGHIRLGTFTKQVSFFGGITKPTGITDATLHNCKIGNNVYISHVKNYIANYIIEEDVVIENIDLLAVEGESSFGNGTEVTAVNEAGGREIPIYDRLSAHTAYVLAFYRNRTQVITRLQKMISDYTKSVTSSMGIVGKGTCLINCRILKNLKIGPATIIEGANKLENGSINSSPEDPVFIGPAVFADNFIVSIGAIISDGTLISKCFIGQSTELSKQYSAENSVFFANCGGFHGEACAIFAGPYTVTHHKSTLLIAGLFSFLNAGSGTNQSNHMYKLGPVHQGIVERGSKTGSDSYILWPAKVGAFTVVMGRHYRNSDTSDLPFSYLIEREDESILVPGINLRSVGTVRDARKWPNRDKRKTSDKLDLINFKLLSPYTIQKMLNARELLKKLKSTSGETSEYFTYHSVKIESASLDRGIALYETGIYKFLGNCLISRLQNIQFKNVEDLQSALKPETEIGTGKWLDLAGLFVPEQEIEKMLSDIENDIINTLEKVEQAFLSMYKNYPLYEWTWAVDILQHLSGKKVDKVMPEDIIELAAKWKRAVVALDNQLYFDAQKEFSAKIKTGFGLDGDELTKHADFTEVRGTFEKDSFVSEIENHIKTKSELAEDLINRLKKLV